MQAPKHDSCVVSGKKNQKPKNKNNTKKQNSADFSLLVLGAKISSCSLPSLPSPGLDNPEQGFREGSNSAGPYVANMFMGQLDLVLNYLSLVLVFSDNIFLKEKEEILHHGR